MASSVGVGTFSNAEAWAAGGGWTGRAVAAHVALLAASLSSAAKPAAPNPLYELWRLRWAEAATLLHGGGLASAAQYAKARPAGRAARDKEPPAPPLVRRWRRGEREWPCWCPLPPQPRFVAAGAAQPRRTPRCRLLAFAVPSAEALAAVSELGLPVVEMGGGVGYWAALLRRRCGAVKSLVCGRRPFTALAVNRRGVAVECFDSAPTEAGGKGGKGGESGNTFHGESARRWVRPLRRALLHPSARPPPGECPPWGPVQRGSSALLASRRFRRLARCHPPTTRPRHAHCHATRPLTRHDTRPLTRPRHSSTTRPRHATRHSSTARPPHAHGTSCRRHALLLCYPPPRAPMAAECLAAFCGDTVVHVGEWLGDTGSPPPGGVAALFQRHAHTPLRRCCRQRGLRGCARRGVGADPAPRPSTPLPLLGHVLGHVRILDTSRRRLPFAPNRRLPLPCWGDTAEAAHCRFTPALAKRELVSPPRRGDRTSPSGGGAAAAFRGAAAPRLTTLSFAATAAARRARCSPPLCETSRGFSAAAATAASPATAPPLARGGATPSTRSAMRCG